jgi:alkylhydroperoxidase family enzyme
MTNLAYAEQDAGIADAILDAAPAREAAEPQLSALEWSVVAVARNDSLASLREPGRLGMAMAALFGARQNPKLTDPRLEALRRFAVLAWHHGYTLPVSEIKALMKAGFSADQFETLLASISRGRAARTHRN